MSCRLILICSASTSATRRARFPPDEPIEAKSSAKAAALARTLPRATRYWCSSALRAHQTAQALSIGAIEQGGLRDQDFGKWAGLTLSEAAQADPAGFSLWAAGQEAAPHGGESAADVLRRVSTLMSELLAETGCTIAVTHPVVIRAAMTYVLGAPVECGTRIDIEPLSFSDFRGDGRRWKVRSCGSPTVT